MTALGLLVASCMPSVFGRVSSGPGLSLVGESQVAPLGLDGLGLIVLLTVIALGLLSLWISVASSDLPGNTILVLLLIVCSALLVTTNNLLLFFVFWEMVTVVGWGLTRKAGYQGYPIIGPLIVHGAGGIASVCMLALVLLLVVENRTLTLGSLTTQNQGLVVALVLCAVLLKSLGLLTQSWQPVRGREAKPTVGFAVVASLAAVGIYPFLRLSWTVLPSLSVWNEFAIPFCLGVALLASVVALGEQFLGRLVSLIALSQMAWLLAGFSLRQEQISGANFAYGLTCLVATAALLVLAGIVQRITRKTDLRQVNGMFWRSPVLAVLFGVAILALIGVPPFATFDGRLAIQVPLLQGQYLASGIVSFAILALNLLALVRCFGAVFVGPRVGEPNERVGFREQSALAVLLLVLLFMGANASLMAEWLGNIGASLIHG